jgi:hypothetical protein
MKHIIALSIIAISSVLMLGCSPETKTADYIEEKPKPKPFTLTCKLFEHDNTWPASIKCYLRNSSSSVVAYSDCSIGARGAFHLEIFDSESEKWTPALYKDGHQALINRSVGASAFNIKKAAPGELVFPYPKDKTDHSYVIWLGNYDLQKGRPYKMRVTQEMGVFGADDLPVWKGKVTSDTVNYDPNKSGLEPPDAPATSP